MVSSDDIYDHSHTHLLEVTLDRWDRADLRHSLPVAKQHKYAFEGVKIHALKIQTGV